MDWNIFTLKGTIRVRKLNLCCIVHMNLTFRSVWTMDQFFILSIQRLILFLFSSLPVSPFLLFSSLPVSYFLLFSSLPISSVSFPYFLFSALPCPSFSFSFFLFPSISFYFLLFPSISFYFLLFPSQTEPNNKSWYTRATIAQV